MALASPFSSPSPSIMSSFFHIVTTKLNTKNYLLWKVQITAYLRGQDLYQYVDGSLVPPSETLPAQSPSTTPQNQSCFCLLETQ